MVSNSYQVDRNALSRHMYTSPRLWQSMGHYHKWMYDEISLIPLVESVGFQDQPKHFITAAFHTSRKLK